MQITSIELSGTSRTTLGDGQAGLPRGFARLSRKPGDEHISVELILPAGETTHSVRANCEEDLWSMAECLQFQLDGFKGTNGAINDYARVLRRLAD